MDSKIVSKLKGRPFKIDTDIIHNKYVLYAILIISILDLIVLSNSQNHESVAIFFLVGFLTYYFNKNMIVILCISLFVTNLLKYGLKIRINEGFEENEENETKKEIMDNTSKDSETDKATSPDDNATENTDKKQDKNKKENTNKTNSESKTANKDNTEEEENKKQGENLNKKEETPDKTPNETEINNIKNADMVTSLNLNNDNKGLEGLENQTIQLINTQKKLIENMKKLEPMLSDAQTFIDKFQNIGIR